MSTKIMTAAIAAEDDVVRARQLARMIAGGLGYAGQDQTRIATAVSEVARNAFMYAGGGTVRFGIDAKGSPPCLEIAVEDRGPGIAAAERERVFEPYVRLEPSRARHTGGSGLGLAIARAVARAHGGDITLSDRAGGGLCAELTLPRGSNSRIAMAPNPSS
jgi:signal transduction histidine kinase